MTNTMKQFTIKGILLILSIMLAGCARYAEPTLTSNPNTIDSNRTEEQMREDALSVSSPVAILEFPSLEAFLNAYLIVRDGASGDINDFVSNSWGQSGESDLLNLAAGADMASLKTLFLPVGIPDDYVLGRIRVNYLVLSLHFFHFDDMASEYAMQEAYEEERHFDFTIWRWDVEESIILGDLLEENNVTEDDLINGIFLFREPNSFAWVSDGVRFGLRLPLRLLDAMNESISATDIDGVSQSDPEELVMFTELRAVNLLDADAITALLNN